jgi:hypothetical protein
MSIRLLLTSLFAFSLFAAGCGSSDVELTDGGPGDTVDADPNGGGDGGGGTGPDANPQVGGECSAQQAQCNNCIDDDGDGFIDGDDLECTGALDDDEDSFATGIPGDNSDAIKQDCFFDGNSGGGDGCDFHVCCLLEPFIDCCEAGQTPEADGCVDFGIGPKFDPAECVANQACIDNCAPLAPPGCDCLGCCTVCEGDNCRDILTNPAVYENETCDGITNPVTGECCDSEHLDACYQCTKVADCGGESCNDDPNDCILCPGQTEADLPASCTAQECPAGTTTCDTSADCSGSDYCSNGCCLHVIQ